MDAAAKHVCGGKGHVQRLGNLSVDVALLAHPDDGAFLFSFAAGLDQIAESNTARSLLHLASTDSGRWLLVKGTSIGSSFALARR